MWYSKDAPEPTLDYSKPIAAIKDGCIYILMPIHSQSNQGCDKYAIIGYDWFNMKSGAYNSCSTFKTPEDAVRCYRNDYTIKNVEINIS